ncbi:MAG: thiamine-phosphate pyrophosphorylase [Candidatus Omnitrophota bacterium]
MNKLLRLIDANLNRSQEGLRVCEDIARFMLNDKTITRSFKSLRHGVSALRKGMDLEKLSLLKSRSVGGDVGKKSTLRETSRKNIKDVFRANTERVKESLRALEEVTKLFDRKISKRFKRMRFRVYELEKKSRLKLDAILHS